MFGTIMNQDIEMVPAKTIDLNIPAQAEIVIEGIVNLKEMVDADGGPNPLMYSIPRRIPQPTVKITAITMRADRPIAITRLGTASSSSSRRRLKVA